MSTATSDTQDQENTPAPSSNDAAPRQTADREVDSPKPSTDTPTESLTYSTLDSSSKIEEEVSATDLEPTPEPEKPSDHQSAIDERSRSPSRVSSTFGDSSLGNRYSSMSSVSTTTGLGSPLPQSSAQRFEPQKAEPGSEEQLPPSPTQRRLSPERPSSPTKGLGGFVQSAMMRRSDSVSKRWSAQIPSGLNRTNSVASNRNSIAVPSQGDASPVLSNKLDINGPALSSHRPGSSHSEATIVHDNAKENERPATPTMPSDINTKSEETASRPPLNTSTHSRPASTHDKDNQGTEHTSASPVVSRTMDPKRWSPTKATWLESALNRPDSPRHRKQSSQSSTWSKDRQSRASVDLSAWSRDRQSRGSVDLSSWSKDRQSKGSVDLGRKNSFKEVTPVGLMRSVPFGGHYKKPSITGIPDLSASLDTSKGKEPSSLEPVAKEAEPLTVDTSATQKDKVKDEINERQNEVTGEAGDQVKAKDEAPPSPSPEKSPEQDTIPEAETTTPEEKLDHRPSPLSLTPTPSIPPSPSSARDPTSPRPKIQSPAIDFRASLRRREVAKESAPKEEPEFKNVFGKLRRTEASSYVAPDALKNNILKGKAALNATGGPKKSAKHDDFQESILRQKEVVKTTGGLSRRNTVEENDSPSQSVPEAIAKRNKLAKSGSVKSNISANASASPSPSPASPEPNTPDMSSEKSPSLSLQRNEAIECPESSQFTSAPESSAAPVAPEPQPSATDLASPSDETSSETKKDQVEDQLQKDEPEPEHERNLSEEATQPVRALPSETVAAVASAPTALPAASEGPAAKGNKLAGRINPSLAGLLSRGPPPLGAGGDGPKKSMPTGLGITGPSGSESSSHVPGAPLTHITKNRVRGPRRRMPGTTATTCQSEPSSQADPEPKSEPEPEPEPKPEQPSSFLGQREVPGDAPEPPIPKPEVPAPREEPVVQPEAASEFEPSVAQPELSAPKGEPTVTESELSAVDEASAQPVLSVSNDERSNSQYDPPGSSVSEKEVVLPSPEAEPPFTESESSLKDEPVTGLELGVPKDELAATGTEPFLKEELRAPSEPPAQKDEPQPEMSASMEKPFHEESTVIKHGTATLTDKPSGEPGSSVPKDEALVVQPELPVSEPEPYAPQSEPSALEGEPSTQTEAAVNQPGVPASETELYAPEGEQSVAGSELSDQSDERLDLQSAIEPEQPSSESEPSAQPEQPPSDDSVPGDKGPSLESTRDVNSGSPDRSIGDSNSNWPLPDGEPMIIGNSQSNRSPTSPSTMRNLTGNPMELRSLQETTGNETRPPQGNVTPQTKKRLSALSPSSSHSYEDVENIGDSPAQKPPVPPKQSPRTPTAAEQRWSPRGRFSSQSPSPLRTSYRENSAELHAGSPRSFAGFLRNKALPSPPVPPKRSGTDLSSPRSSASLVPLADESMEVISDFFKTFPRASDRVDIDPQLMLTSRSDDLKIRTVKKQVWEITSDGKRQDLPVNQEYILYQGSMYLCIHTFESDGTTRSEAHLWCGDDVPDNAVDDAQSFSRKMAKENGCKLELIKQGKETTRFIHALGGILIIRRGFNSRSSLSALYMLCGRKHLNQMVFDEVDFSRHNLCSGFPFVISAPFGKLYLWKGKGSTAEEIGAARLIGMDLGLTGEFEEVTEGEEPESFSEIFSYRDTEQYMQADYWQAKPNHEHFRCRLLRVDHELGQRSGFWIRRPGSSSPVIRPNDTVQEVEPYCLKDLSAKGIYILDIYFELYV